MAIIKIHLRIMDLEGEELETTLIEEEVEADSTPMGANNSCLKHLKVSLLIIIKIQHIRVIHLLMLLRLIDLHVRFVGNLDILPWTVTTE